MDKLLCLFICTLMSLLLKIGATAVHWPSGYSVEWEAIDESSGLSMVAKQYLSEGEGAVRWDLYGGENTFILKLKDPKTKGLCYYFPETVGADVNKMNCFFIPGLPLENVTTSQYGLPNTEGYSKSGMISVNGAQVQEWTYKINKYGILSDGSLWINMGTKTEGPIPVKAHTTSYDDERDASFISAFRRNVLYYNYIPQEPEKSIWDGPNNVDCHIPSQEDLELVKDIYDAIIGNVPSPAESTSKQVSVSGKKYKGLKISSSSQDSALPFPYTDDEVREMAAALPKSFDWRLRGAVTEVKDQMRCGSCWAFGTVGSMEGAYFLKTGILTDMSEQALMDCGWTHDPDDNTTIGGCFGNYPENAFKWIENHGGLPLTVDYGNYREINGRCKLNNIKPVAPIKGYVHVHNNTDAVKVALYHHGPLTVLIYCPPEFYSYTHGVLHSSKRGHLDHSVLLVGYGSLDGDDYWIIKNSWARSWGLLGYALISTANNTLRLLDAVWYPIMK
ncbi:hypothetical protein GE061_002866 [Apolygus lucorum]|uniref:Peptidase C1A papain C-terminal domain-containing protein n=1 Tax=Apolygus lucorum TaxID=248454 RepID=A0A8S9X7Q2_APOLU|nr:hypothetical protein GE061_002866 [Apolygus lucorum]